LRVFLTIVEMGTAVKSSWRGLFIGQSSSFFHGGNTGLLPAGASNRPFGLDEEGQNSSTRSRQFNVAHAYHVFRISAGTYLAAQFRSLKRSTRKSMNTRTLDERWRVGG
jgi:hypothetical protein